MRKRLKSIAAVLGLLGASVFLALGAAEACLRLFPGLMPEEAQLRLHWRERGWSQPVTLPDPYLGYAYPPNHVAGVRGLAWGDDFAFTFTTDEHGFRNPSPWPERAGIPWCSATRWRSATASGDDQTWTALLGARLPGSRIINLGFPGAAPQQYLRSSGRNSAGLCSPALVLFCLFPGNDVGDARLFDRWVKAGSQGNYLMHRFAEDGLKTGQHPARARAKLSRDLLT